MTKVPPACPCTTCHRSYAAAAYLQSIGFSKRVFLIGNEGVAEELEAAGIDYVTLEQLCAEAASGSNGSSSSSGGMASSAAALQQQWTAEALANLQVRSWAGALLACLAASMLDQYVWFCSMASIMHLLVIANLTWPPLASSPSPSTARSQHRRRGGRLGPLLFLHQGLHRLRLPAGAAGLPLCGHQP